MEVQDQPQQKAKPNLKNTQRTYTEGADKVAQA
jgi:hypothetical protein